MRKTFFVFALSIWVGSALPSLAGADDPPQMNRAQSVVNAFQVMCTLELPNFDHIDARAAAMKMVKLANTSGPSANNTVTRRKVWAGALRDGPFSLLIDEMTGPMGRSTACAIVADAPDADAFRAEAVSAMRLQGAPAPEMGNDGMRSFVWSGAFGAGTLVIVRDRTPRGLRGVMVKLTSMVGPSQ